MPPNKNDSLHNSRRLKVSQLNELLASEKINRNEEVEFLNWLKSKTIMVWACCQDAYDSEVGQGPRDCLKVNKLLTEFAMRVRTLDNKHNSIFNKHCNTDFNSFLSFKLDVERYFPDTIFDIIELDPFFSPPNWNNERWKIGMINSICQMAKIGKLSLNGKVFLPYFESIKGFMEDVECLKEIEMYFSVKLVIPRHSSIYHFSPMYYAALLCDNELKTLIPPVYNDNQERYFVGKCFGWYILSNIHIPDSVELSKEKLKTQRQLESVGYPNTRFKSGTGI